MNAAKILEILYCFFSFKHPADLVNDIFSSHIVRSTRIVSNSTTWTQQLLSEPSEALLSILDCIQLQSRQFLPLQQESVSRKLGKKLRCRAIRLY